MIKITPADSAFSKCVRARVNWTCERCDSKHERNSTGLHCSHFIGRGNWSVRFEPNNALALCYGCHMLMQGDPIEHKALVESLLSPDLFDDLVTLSNDSKRGRFVRKTKGIGEIAKYYRNEYQRLCALRDAGEWREIEFDAWGWI